MNKKELAKEALEYFSELNKQSSEEEWESFWKEVVTNEDGSINLDQVKKELNDFSMMIDTVTSIYSALSGGRISKPTTDPIHVIGLHEDAVEESYNEGFTDGKADGIDENTSDGYHTFKELYNFRLLYNAAFLNELAHHDKLDYTDFKFDVHKSRKHNDGEYPFGKEDWFIVMAELPTGQISNHYEMKYWSMFQIPEKEVANKWDGHTSEDVAKRLQDFIGIGLVVSPTRQAKFVSDIANKNDE